MRCAPPARGYTIVVSPLLALMRDQIAAAGRAGLVAATVNSTNVEDWSDVLDGVRGGSVDVLLISPERLANPRFAAQLPALLAGCGLLVIDEAHCVSDWGFDFRPDYQRLTHTLLALAPGTPVLATTATANARVTEDVATQLGDDTVTLRGSLARTSLRLAVVPHLDGVQRAAWVADALGRLPGSGIVYVLTVAETDRVAGLLTDRGYDVAAYSSAVGTAEREALEDRLRRNEIKALVATSALGMGFDKPDLAFCIHVGSPASPVAYYQQVGRAGRALDDAVAVLLPSAGDERVWEYFATSGIPVPEHVDAVLGALAAGASSVPAIESATRLRRGRVEALLKILAVDGVVARGVDGWAATGTPWTYDAAKWAALRRVREAEADLMRHYAAGDGCLMQFLQQALDDPDPTPVRAVFGVHRRASLPRRVRQRRLGRGDVALPAHARRRARAAQAVAERPGRSQGQDRRMRASAGRWPSPTTRRGATPSPPSARMTDRSAPRSPTRWSAVLSRWRRSWERPVVVVPMPSRRRPRADPLARRAHRHRRQAPARRRLGGQWPAATERRRLGRPGIGAARFAAGHRRRPPAGRSRPARRRHLPLRVDRHGRRRPAHRRRGDVGPSRS